MGEPHVAIAEAGGGLFFVAAVDLPGLAPEVAEAVGTRGVAAYAEAGAELAKEVCASRGLTLVLRTRVREATAEARVLVSGFAADRGRIDDVRAAVGACETRLSGWRAVGLDRASLDRELEMRSSAEAVRVVKPDAVRRTPHEDVPLLAQVDTALRFDRLPAADDEIVVDLALFHVDGFDVGSHLRRTAAAAKVLAARLPAFATELERNAGFAAAAATAGGGLGTAVTVVRSSGAPRLREPFTGAAGKGVGDVGWSLTTEDLSPEELAFQALDYDEERGRRASLEPAAPRVFEAHADLTSGGAGAASDIFISYPRKRIAWVKEHIYQPLRSRGWSIFFDMDSIEVGSVWSSRLAGGANDCRVFLPVFCEEYWQSPFCKWEWGIAFRRDPSGEQGLVVPVLLDGSPLPAECGHVQAADVRRPDFRDSLLAALAARLGRAPGRA